MEGQFINMILIYNINQKDKIIGKLNNVSTKETLRNIRPYIRKMDSNNEFISIKVMNQIETIDIDVEDTFLIEDILIYEYGVFKIYINGPIRNELNNMNNNININEPIQNQRMQMNNNNINNYNLINNMNNFQQNMFNTLQNQNQFNNNCINPMFNNMNNNNLNNNMNNFQQNMFIPLQNQNQFNNNCINPMFNNMNNNMNNGMNNFMNFNKNNNMNNMENNYNFNNNIFNNNMPNIPNINNIINNNIINNMNNINEIGMAPPQIQMMNNFRVPNNMIMNNPIPNNMNISEEKKLFPSIKRYNVTFKFPSGFIYFLIGTYYKIINDFLKSFFLKLNIDSIPWNISFFYKEEDITHKFETLEEYFKNDQNPAIIIKDAENFPKFINVTFKDNHGNQLLMIVNQNMRINRLLIKYYHEIKIYSNEKEIQFICNKKNIKFEDQTTLGNYFNIDVNNNIFISVNDKKNVINIINVIFKDNHGGKVEIFINKTLTKNDLIREYFIKVERYGLIDQGGDIIFL